MPPEHDAAVLASFRDLMAQIDALDALVEGDDRRAYPAICTAWRDLRLALGFAIGAAYGAGCVLVSHRLADREPEPPDVPAFRLFVDARGCVVPPATPDAIELRSPGVGWRWHDGHGREWTTAGGIRPGERLPRWVVRRLADHD